MGTMGMLPLAEIEPLLICPRCAAPVGRDASGLHCDSDSCALRSPGSFPLAGRWPALVDFEHSILAPPEPEHAPLEQPGQGRWSIARLPRWLRRLWKPRNRVAAANIATLLRETGSGPLILVVGGGTVGNGVEAIYERRRARVIGFDIYASPYVQLIADAHRIPIADASVDAVVVQAVLEHVLEPSQVVAEIHRVLRPGGLVYAETPFMQQVHAGPYDFTRYTSSGHRYLFRSFEEIAAGPVAGPGTQLLTSVDHLVRGLLRSQLAGRIARAACFWLRFADRLVPTAYAIDNASAYYFFGRRSERELSPHEIVAYYRGAQGSATGVDRAD